MSAARRLALIPARGGSRRLPRKNVMDFAGRPMLAWTVDAAARSGLFADIVVSTDDDQIAAAGRAAGAQVLMRGDDISNDAATLIQVLRDTLARWPQPVDEVGLLLANCPLRTEADIAAGHAEFVATRAPAMLSVTSYGWTPPFRAQFLREGKLEPVFGEWTQKKSQEYPAVVCVSGAVYWARPDAVRSANDLYVDGIGGFMMPWHRAIDIDTREDLELAMCVRHGLDNGFRFGA